MQRAHRLPVHGPESAPTFRLQRNREASVDRSVPPLLRHTRQRVAIYPVCAGLFQRFNHLDGNIGAVVPVLLHPACVDRRLVGGPGVPRVVSPNAMTSSAERTSAESKNSRLPHREVTDGPSNGGTKQPISVLKQILGRKGFPAFGLGLTTYPQITATPRAWKSLWSCRNAGYPPGMA